MGWETFTSLDGIYAVQWEVVGRMIRSFVRSSALLDEHYAKVNTEFHWIGPNLHTLDVDWDKVRQRTDDESERLLADFYRNAQSNTQSQIARLKHWVDITRHNNAAFQKKMRDAQRQTMANIEKSVGRMQSDIEVARFVRDSSAEFLMVSATIVTGGATVVAGGAALSTGAAAGVSAGALATGAALKATARAQDDPHASKGAIAATFASEFVIGMMDFGVGKAIEGAAERAGEQALLKAVGGDTAKKLVEQAAKKGTKLALAILWNQVKGATLEPGKAILQGKTFGEGLVTGGLKTVGGIHGEILKHLVLDDSEFPKLAAFADTAISFGMDKLAESLNEKNRGEKSGRAGVEQTAKTLRPREPDHAPLDALAYEIQMIERTAIRKVGSAGPPVANPYFPHGKASATFKR